MKKKWITPQIIFFTEENIWSGNFSFVVTEGFVNGYAQKTYKIGETFNGYPMLCTLTSGQTIKVHFTANTAPPNCGSAVS